MGHRLSKIVTKTGDAGTTGLGDGSRVAKDSARIAAIGEVDELNCVVGVMLAEALPDAVRACLTSVQHDLFDLGGELSIPGYTAVTDAHVARLEADVERFNAELAPLKEFILPGGSPAAARAHVGRTVCRRAERALVRLAAEAPVGDPARRYLNRLSDLLFVLARWLNRDAGCGDVLWKKERPPGRRLTPAGPYPPRACREPGVPSGAGGQPCPLPVAGTSAGGTPAIFDLRTPMTSMRAGMITTSVGGGAGALAVRTAPASGARGAIDAGTIRASAMVTEVSASAAMPSATRGVEGW